MKAVLYARVSSEQQAEKDLSIPAQLRAMRDYAIKRDWEIFKEFIDAGESARTANRPQFQEMISLAKQKTPPFNVILVWKLSRFARSREDSITYKTLLRKNGVQVISINEQIDDSPTGKLLEGIIESVDEFYSSNLAQDTVRGMKENAQRGFFNGGHVPYGYDVDHIEINKKMKRTWKINEEESQVVQKMYNLCLNGLGAKEIVKEFAKEGIKNRLGNQWSRPHVYYILKNENYTGTYVWNRKGQGRYQNHHPKIIEKQTFINVQQMLAKRSPKQIHPREVSSNHLLTGLIFCKACNKKMKVVSAKSGNFRYYICPNSLNIGKHVCKNKSYNIEKANEYVIKIIKERVLTEAHLVKLVDMVGDELTLLRAQHSKTVYSIQKKLDDIDRRIKKLYQALETDQLTMDVIAPRLNDLYADRNALLAEHEEITERVGDGNQIPKLTVKDIKGYVDDLKNTLSKSSLLEQKCFIRSFVKRIDVSHPKAEIEYTVPLIPPKSKEPLKKEVLSITMFGSQEWDRTTDQSVTI